MSESWIDDLLGDEKVNPEFEAGLRSRMLAAADRRRRPRWLLPAAAALVAMAGVGTVVGFADRRESGRPVQVEPSTGPTSPPVATSPVLPTTSSIASGAPSTVPPSTGPTQSSAVAPLPPTVAPEPSTSTVPPTEPPSITDPPATTETIPAAQMAAAGALDLRHGTVFGLSASSSHDAATAVELISRSLGEPTSDTTEMTALYCPDPARFRIVQWNDLVLVFGWSGDTEYLSSWQLGDPDQQIAIEPVEPDLESSPARAITTAEGIGIGSRASALDGFSPVVTDTGQMVIVGDVEPVAVTIRDGVIVGLWSGPWDWDCGDEPR